MSTPAASLIRTEWKITDAVTALLPGFKAYALIEDPAEDAQAAAVLGAIISQAEGVLGVSVAAASYAWTPYPADPIYGSPTAGALLLPVRGVRTVTVARGVDDVTGSYVVRGPTTTYGEVWLVPAGGGAMTGGDVVTIGVGMPATDPLQWLDPGLTYLLYRWAADLWEHRESAGDFQTYPLPDWLNAWLLTWWVPRC